MKRNIFLIAVVVLMGISLNTLAGPATNTLGICLTDSLTGKERKTLAKWIFFAIAAHPEISSFSKVTEESQDQTNQFVGNLITRLMADDCPNQAKAALKEDGSVAFEQAFGMVGQVAMQELMADQNVTRSISGFEKYVDQAKISALGE